MQRLGKEFFMQEAKVVAKKLIGKVLCCDLSGELIKAKIVETEAYLGEEDSASHARFGPKSHASAMWAEGGKIYVYLCYGLHYLFNITTGKEGRPQAVLIRGVEGAVGPGRLTKKFGITTSLSWEDITSCPNIWVEDGESLDTEATPRIGIGFAKPKDIERKLRFVLKK